MAPDLTAREGAVHPARLLALQQEAADEVGGGEVLVAGDGDHGQTGGREPLALGAVLALAHHGEWPAELVGHVLDEARLAAAGGALEQHRDFLLESGAEELLLITDLLVVRLLGGGVLLHGVHAELGMGVGPARHGRCAP